MRVLRTIAEVRALRPGFARLGLVPTMGFLHAGHMSLVARAQAECGACAVSIFVNPTQFAPNDDLSRYPRDMPRDMRLLGAAGVDLVFAPEPAEVYPPGSTSRIEVGPVSEPLEGARRPGHFAGVATVVAKLFNIVQPTRAYFGQKDAQQVAVIRRMARDLDMPLDVVVGETVREPDGLAMSSRNIYLSPPERAAAPALFGALDIARRMFAGGEGDAETLRRAMRDAVAAEPAIELDYVSVADGETLREVERARAGCLASLAARLGRTRLIDNVVLGRSGI